MPAMKSWNKPNLGSGAGAGVATEAGAGRHRRVLVPERIKLRYELLVSGGTLLLTISVVALPPEKLLM